LKVSGDVGIWHETYLVPAGRYEAIYGNMPRMGLATAAGRIAVVRRAVPLRSGSGRWLPTTWRLGLYRRILQRTCKVGPRG
jgi:hypothetical protein